MTNLGQTMPSYQNLNRIRIVLVDTQDAANIGSTCRAMKTMGLTRLVLVTDKVYDENRVRTLALHASDLYENREEYTSLEEALSDSVLTVAATRRHGRGRKTSCVDPFQLAQRIEKTGPGDISIVFGRESDGLTDKEVRCCSMVVTIPTSDAFPSLNLAQAVQIVTFSLFSTLREFNLGYEVVPAARIAQAAEVCTNALEEMGYFKNQEEKRFTSEFLSDSFCRCAYTEGEVKKMEKIFIKASHISSHKKR